MIDRIPEHLQRDIRSFMRYHSYQSHLVFAVHLIHNKLNTFRTSNLAESSSPFAYALSLLRSRSVSAVMVKKVWAFQHLPSEIERSI